LVAAFTKIFKQGRKPEVLQSDAGTEFKNKNFKHFSRSMVSVISSRTTRQKPKS